MNTTTPSKPSRGTRQTLVLRDPDQPLLLARQDASFVATVGEAIDALRHQSNVSDTMHALDGILDRLAKWLVAWRTEVERAYFAPKDGRFLFMVVQSVPQFNEPLLDALADLDVELANEPSFEPLEVETLAAPAGAAGESRFASFLPAKGVFEFDPHG